MFILHWAPHVRGSGLDGGHGSQCVPGSPHICLHSLSTVFKGALPGGRGNRCWSVVAFRDLDSSLLLYVTAGPDSWNVAKSNLQKWKGRDRISREILKEPSSHRTCCTWAMFSALEGHTEKEGCQQEAYMFCWSEDSNIYLSWRFPELKSQVPWNRSCRSPLCPSETYFMAGSCWTTFPVYSSPWGFLQIEGIFFSLWDSAFTTHYVPSFGTEKHQAGMDPVLSLPTH